MENQDIIPSIVVAAVAAAGPKGSNDAAWKAKINDAIPHIAAMIHDGTRQWRIAEEVLDASVFVATYIDHEIEESSTRAVVHIDTGKPTKNYPDGIEPIRTHRTDNAQGRSMKARLDKLERGDEIVVWKALEAMGDGADAQKVRVLVHFETRPKRQERSQRESVPAGEQRGTDRAEERRAPEPARQPVDESNPVTDRFNKLPSKVKVEVVKRLRAEDISFPDPGPEDVDRFIIIINEVEKDHS